MIEQFFQRRYSTRRVALQLLCGAAILLPTALPCQRLAAQETAEETDESAPAKVVVPLLDREPFYQLVLDAQNKNAVLDILPVENLPSNPKKTDRLRIRLVSDPEQMYEVFWEHIVKVRTYEQIIMDEAQKLTSQKKYNEAFPFWYYLIKNTKAAIALNRSVLEYMLTNAADLVAQGNFEHALAILEEVTKRDSSFRQAEVATRLATVSDKLLSDYVKREDYRRARGLIIRLAREYGPTRVESLGRWRTNLINKATALKQEAQQLVQAGEFRRAEQLSRDMVRVWPALEGAEQLSQEIARKYPMVIVGVSEAAGAPDVTSINSWSARRAGRLTRRTLLEFLGAGPEGGQYLCSLGSYEQSDDRRGMTLQLDPTARTAGGLRVDGYDVARRVLQMADPGGDEYDPAWASLFANARVEDVFRLQIALRRPHVLPEAMLQIRLDPPSHDPAAPSPSEGPYVSAPADDDYVHFVLNPRFPFGETKPPSEIEERHFSNAQDAIAALKRGDVDVLDYLFPDDATFLKNDKSLHVVQYALPTVHVLVPNYHNPFTSSQTFRRALVYGINRKAILDSEILGNKPIRGCQVVSGPFPVGARDNDPLAYAYDELIEPRSYYPRLAAILKTLAKRELKEMASKRGEEIPKDVKLTIGYPGNEVARVACQAIAQYLQVIGMECRLVELPPAESNQMRDDIDLLYMQIAMWEPVIDARRLLAPSGVADVGNEYVGMALRRLDSAKNWREARERLHELHRIVHEQVAVVPLWQTVNYLAYRDRLRGVGPQPLTLYQDIEQWRVTPIARTKQ